METVIDGYGTLMEATLVGTKRTKYCIRYLQAYVSCGLYKIDLTYNYQKIIYFIFIDLLFPQSFLRFNIIALCLVSQ
jgi:hypothetical protein